LKIDLPVVICRKAIMTQIHYGEIANTTLPNAILNNIPIMVVVLEVT